MLAAGLPVRVVGLTVGHFDTHAGQTAVLQRDLQLASTAREHVDRGPSLDVAVRLEPRAQHRQPGRRRDAPEREMPDVDTRENRLQRRAHEREPVRRDDKGVVDLVAALREQNAVEPRRDRLSAIAGG